jgi:hypothetical protein
MDILLGIILFFILLWYGLKLFLRYVAPWLLRRFVRNQQSKFGGFYQQQQQQQTHPDGEIKIDKDKSQKSKDDGSFGEYVDFEDMKE